MNRFRRKFVERVNKSRKRLGILVFRFVLRFSGLWNEQRRIEITILETGLDSLFPFTLATGQERRRKTSKGFHYPNLSLRFPWAPLALTSSRTVSTSFLLLSVLSPLPAGQLFHLPFSISGLEIHPILVHEDFNLVWSRYRHVLIFLSIFRATCSPFLPSLCHTHLLSSSLSLALSLSLSLSCTPSLAASSFHPPSRVLASSGRGAFA